MKSTLLAVLPLTLAMVGQPATAQQNISPVLTKQWADTGIRLTAGQPLNISATSHMDFATGDCTGSRNCDVGLPC
jgi:hypothetical protein